MRKQPKSGQFLVNFNEKSLFFPCFYRKTAIFRKTHRKSFGLAAAVYNLFFFALV